MGEFSPWHLAILALVFVVLFGAKRLPDAARSAGRSLRIFKSEIKGMHEDDQKPAATDPVQAAIPAPLPSAPVEDTTARVPSVSDAR